ncbi:MAG: hypothetical protein K1V88_02915 [Muribaculaceae bacterium]
METRGLKNGMVELVADPGKRLHLKDTDIYAAKAPVAPGSVGGWEEVDSVPAYTKGEYDHLVAAMVRERYSESEEFAIQRKMLHALIAPAPLGEGEDLSGPAVDEFAEYNAYVEECKLRAKDASLYADGKGGDA